MIIIILKASYYISGSRGGSPLYPLENLNFLHLYIIKLSKNIPRTPPPPFYPPTNLVIPQLSLKRIPGSAHVLPIVLCVSLGGISSYSDTWQITLSNWIGETVIVTSDICCIVTSYFFVYRDSDFRRFLLWLSSGIQMNIPMWVFQFTNILRTSEYTTVLYLYMQVS